jgi:Tol biopolymer transport system component/tRNA A-37 threonylcarbamoyl transferase component Bud32
MSLSAGARLGPYEIVAPLGAGGMGEVYRARDTRLGRTVAIKIVSSGLSANDDARRRFEREARAVSSLNHPHICTLFDIGREEGLDYLVMEHLEGETLSQRLARDPLPVDEALRHAIEIAEALDAAHAQGVVHRDLKPGNVMLTRSGAKLLDFGLASLAEIPRDPAADLASAPTRTVEGPHTGEGAIFGTVQYMAPEQLERKAIDARTDIFALGQVIHEMVTGRKAFEGSTSAAVAAAILKTEPPPASQVRAELPYALDHLIGRCLAKNPEDRWRSAHDVALQLRWIRDVRLAPQGASQTAARMVRRARLGWIAAAGAGLVGLALVLAPTLSPRAPAPGAIVRFTVDSPEGATVDEPYWSHPAVSPDGRNLAFVAFAGGQPRLWLRPLDAVAARALPGTEGAIAPFWSPDSRWVAFFTGGLLKKTPVGAGTPQTLCEVAGAAACGSWGSSGTILFAVQEGPEEQNGLYRVSESGGPASMITFQSPAGPDVVRPFFPHFLPDGRRFLWFPESGAFVGIASIDAPKIEPLPDYVPTSQVEYAPPGYLFSVREHTLLAHRFDAATGKVRGEPIHIAENVLGWSNVAASFSVSRNGVVAYRPLVTAARWLAWFDRTGRNLETIGGQAAYFTPRISPDGQRFTVGIDDPRTAIGRVWIYQIPQGNPARLQPEDVDSYSPIWSPDGRDIVLSMPTEGPPSLIRMNLAQKDVEVVVPQNGRLQVACDWSSDGQVIVYSERDPKTGMDLWQVSPTGDRKPEPILQTRFEERGARLSPDSRWLAYVSDESGQFEVYVQPFPGPGERRRVSRAGGSGPRWRGDGKELFYVTPERDVVSVPFNAADTQPAGPPLPLFRVTSKVVDYDVTRDGQRFLIIHDAEAAQPPIHVVVNWEAGISP